MMVSLPDGRTLSVTAPAVAPGNSFRVAVPSAQQPIVTPAAVTALFCTSCGASLTVGANFCTECGSAQHGPSAGHQQPTVDQAAATTTQQLVTEPAPSPAPAQSTYQDVTQTPTIAEKTVVEFDSSKSLGINIGDVEANDVVVEIDSA